MPGSSPDGSRYVVTDREFTKLGLANARAEFDKARALCALGRRCGFVAPEAKRFDTDLGSVTYDFLPGLTPIRTAYLACMSDDTAAAPLARIEQAGSVLATIHRMLSLPESERWAPTAEFEAAFGRVSDESCASWMARVPWAQAHCDYGFSNVQLSGENDAAIVVLDASANGFMTFATALQAPIYIDIANFVACLEGLVPPRNFVRMKWRRLQAVREVFLNAYERTAAIVLDRPLVRRIAYATAHCYFKREYRSPLITRLALGVLFNRAKGNEVVRGP